MFADIMYPVLPMGIDVELVENVGPVVREPVRTRRRRRAAARRRPGGDARPDSRGGAARARGAARPTRRSIGFCGGPFTVAGYLVEGRPSRDFATVKALMYARAGRLARADGEARRDVRRLRAGEGARRRGRDPALRLVGRRAVARGLRRVRRAVLGAHPRRGRRADDPLRHRHGDAARPDGRRGRRRDRPRLADPARPRLGSRRRAAPCRATSTRRRCSGRGSASRPPPTTCSSAPPAGPGHIFNLGHGVFPQTDPEVLGRLREHVHAATAAGRTS